MCLFKTIKEWALDYLLSLMPDKIYLKLKYRVVMRKKLDLSNPRTFTEKLQWLKLYNRKPEYTTMVDKYTAKEYVAAKIGGEYIIPTLGIWDRPEDIAWDSLPSQFVLKTTHGGGNLGVVIVKDKSSIDKELILQNLNKNLKLDLYKRSREWPYKNVKKRIMAEKYMFEEANVDGDLTDYKFYCFNGVPMFCQVIRNRRTKETIDFYDMQWNHMPFVGLTPVACNIIPNSPVAKPAYLKLMIGICRNLSKDIPFVRIDLYVIDGKVYFGEITFFPAAGIGKFEPDEWNEKLGEMIKLPVIN